MVPAKYRIFEESGLQRIQNRWGIKQAPSSRNRRKHSKKPGFIISFILSITKKTWHDCARYRVSVFFVLYALLICDKNIYPIVEEAYHEEEL